ncbi:ABC transporter substrate-binding protein [candidate division WOR-3 bacterium]|nr:ABC transporter substrate-binding protein [candidate division WOR-3 bacterium]
MKKHILTAVIIVLAGVLATIIIIPLVKMSKPTEVKVLVEHSVSSLPVYFAKSYDSWARTPADTIQKGDVFTRNEVKLEVTVEEELNPSKAIEALIQGEVQFAVLPWPDVLLWMSEHPTDTLRCLLSVEFRESRPVEGLFPKQGLKFNKITDLENKKIGVTSGTEFSFKVALAALGIDPADVIIQVYPPQELLSALESGEMDLVLAIEPCFTQARTHISEPFAGGGFLPNWIGSPYHSAGIFTTSKYYAENKTGVIRMHLAMKQVVREIDLAASDSLGLFLGSVLGIDDPQVTTRIKIPEYFLPLAINPYDLQDLSDRLEIFGVIQTSPNLDELGVFFEQKDLAE